MSCDVTFRISAQTSIGENVYVVGDHERIGSWNLERALLAHTSGETYPIWSAQASFLAEKTVQFKYVKRNGAGAAVWESMQQNRTVSLQPNTVITLNSEFNNSEVQETVETKSVEVKTLEDEVKGVTKHNNMLESTATPVSSLSASEPPVSEPELFSEPMPVLSADPVFVAKSHLPVIVDIVVPSATMVSRSFTDRIADEESVESALRRLSERRSMASNRVLASNSKIFIAAPDNDTFIFNNEHQISPTNEASESAPPLSEASQVLDCVPATNLAAVVLSTKESEGPPPPPPPHHLTNEIKASDIILVSSEESHAIVPSSPPEECAPSSFEGSQHVPPTAITPKATAPVVSYAEIPSPGRSTPLSIMMLKSTIVQPLEQTEPPVPESYVSNPLSLLLSPSAEPTPIVMNGGGGGGGTAGDHPVVTTMMNGSGKHMTADDHENSGKAVNGKGNHSTEKMGKKNRKVLKAVGAVLSSLSRSVMCYGPGTSSLRERRKANALKKANGKSVVVVANGV